MRFIGLAGVVLAGSFAITGPAAAESGAACLDETPCPLEVAGQPERQYYVALPSDIDPATPLPVLVWYHGHGGSGLGGIKNRGFVEDWTRAGWIFVAADALNGRWTHQGTGRDVSPDDAYSVAILDDLAERYPIDRGRLVAAGFSSGGFMVWTLACYQGAPFTHFAPVSGAFWEPLPDGCTAGPVTMLHMHGTADTTVPLEGRWLRNTYKQGDVFDSIGIMVANDACAAEPETVVMASPEAECQLWSSCAAGGSIELCLHDRGHEVPRGWSAAARAWVEATLPLETH